MIIIIRGGGVPFEVKHYKLYRSYSGQRSVPRVEAGCPYWSRLPWHGSDARQPSQDTRGLVSVQFETSLSRMSCGGDVWLSPEVTTTQGSPLCRSPGPDAAPSMRCCSPTCHPSTSWRRNEKRNVTDTSPVIHQSYFCLVHTWSY